MQITQIRNATLLVDYAGKTLLVDPLLAERGAYPGFAGTANSHLANPLVDLPMPLAALFDVDAVLVTHLHLDHWDETARRTLPRALPVFAQNEADAQSIRADGFTDVRPLAAHGDTGMIDRALDSMARVFGTRRAQLERMLVGTWTHDWQRDPFSRGAYSYAGVGGVDAHKELAKPLQSTLFFAGEATNGEQTGTVAGAIVSGRRAAAEVRRRIKP